MAASISVAVGDKDTMALGRVVIVTDPLATCTVTGKAPVDADDAVDRLKEEI